MLFVDRLISLQLQLLIIRGIFRAQLKATFYFSIIYLYSTFIILCDTLQINKFSGIAGSSSFYCKKV